jgi:hypothetical protein
VLSSNLAQANVLFSKWKRFRYFLRLAENLRDWTATIKGKDNLEVEAPAETNAILGLGGGLDLTMKEQQVGGQRYVHSVDAVESCMLGIPDGSVRHGERISDLFGV